MLNDSSLQFTILIRSYKKVMRVISEKCDGSVRRMLLNAPVLIFSVVVLLGSQTSLQYPQIRLISSETSSDCI